MQDSYDQTLPTKGESPSAPYRRRPHARKLLGLFAGALIAVSLASLAWHWWDWSRPGQRHYQRGLELMAANDPAGAIDQWTLGLERDPMDPRCFEMAADFYAEAHKFGEAASLYERATKLSPRNGPLFLKLSNTFRNLGRQQQALVAAEQAAKLMPEDADAIGRYGLLLKGAKRRPEALEALRRAETLRPHYRLHFLAMVDLEMDTLQMKQAEKALQGYLSRHPDDPEACFRMAVVFNQKPRTPEHIKTATRYAERALVGLAHNPRPYTVLGQLYLDEGRPAEALKLYLKGHEVSPFAESILRGLADCYSRLGKTRELAAVSAEYQKVLKRHDRIDHLTHVMSFNPKDVKAALELASLSEEEGLIHKAQEYYEQLVRQASTDPRTRKALSGFYQRTGRPQLAKRALEPAFFP